MKKGPLNNIVVLDLTRAVSGPYCTMMLYNLGATIIKIEHPGNGDDTRGLGPFIEKISSYNAIFNYGKKSIALDLKNEADRKIFEELLPKVDVLVENFRPGFMEKFGYGWEALHKKYPQLIYAAISGYGQTGPIATHACYDLVAQGICGIMMLTGHSENEPTKVGTEIADVLSGIFTAFGINTALFHRERTGEGSLVDVAMLDCMLSLLYSAVDRYTATHEIPHAIGNRHPIAAPFDTFYAKDRPLNIAVANDNLFRKLCGVLKRPELADDERFATIPARTKNRVALTNIMAEILKTKNATEWLEDLVKAGIPAGRIYTLKETLDFPQLIHRKMVHRFKGDYMPTIRFPGNPLKLSCLEDLTENEKAPALDENRQEILNFIKTGKWLRE
ncbi:MAG: hypothetical protein A3E87_08380 [Gammaproteobacteria bacterium RIFCSPHIGHO2_12_FULL_35_23]|nr:MAG: hypothetical protein A3E87_08380 [Gammaproteobacteria bacterium RIFCSPHIGHO2_12_FULL_35_23]